MKVTNKKNGKTVEVEITDRGPFVSGRIIDLSVAAAKKIGMIKCGVTQVHIDIVSQPTTIKKKYKKDKAIREIWWPFFFCFVSS